MTLSQPVHTAPIARAAEALSTDIERGLSRHEAGARLNRYGANELQERARPGLLHLLLGQFNNFLVIILIAATVISLALGEIVDGLAILAIVVLNAVLGVVQESKAEESLAALKKMASPNALVLRDGQQEIIPARELAPGDIVLLEAGNYVPADMRLIESINLKIDEASLTGESVPAYKDARVVLDADIPLGDRKNTAFMSTLVTYGRGKGLVTATGMSTQIGMIAEMLQSFENEMTPLQRKLNELGRVIGVVALAICGVIFVYGLARDTELAMVVTEGAGAYLAGNRQEIVELFMTAVSLAIAAVPEGLAAVVTICLALGMQRMVQRHALIRKLPAVETLGCATVICSDKTGTLTQNEMTAVRGWAGGSAFAVSGEGYNPEGQFTRNSVRFAPLDDPATEHLLRGALLCNDARLEPSGEESGIATWRMIGDPTEGALVVAAAKAGLWRADVEAVLPRVAEVPFDSERKRMSTIHRILTPAGSRLPGMSEGAEPIVAFTKGAPDIVLDYCDSAFLEGEVVPLAPAVRQEILDANSDMARQALRVLGVAYRPLSSAPQEPQPEEVEQGLIFLGLLGMIDPARPEVKDAVAVARGAGMKSVMVTGDFKETATAIAAEIGILSADGRVLTGAELEGMSDEELVEVVEDADAFARVSPQHKMRIVDAFKSRGHIVAMTGDGVNDAPALKRADIGVAMGISGTDVTKEVADMVLTDDNYASIVSAVEEGRAIYSNIRKFVFYLLACNVGEILIIFSAMLAGLPIPLSPIMLLMLNLVTDGAPAVALGLEKGDPDIMQRPPRPAREPVINREMLPGMIAIPIADTAAVLGAFLWALHRFPGHLAAAQTVAFATLVCSELLRAYTSRSEHQSVFTIGLMGNRWMVWATAASFVLLLLVIYVPFLQVVFGTVPLGLGDWLRIIPLFFIAPLVAELLKLMMRRRNVRPASARP